MRHIAIRPELTGHEHSETPERCAYCGRQHAAGRLDAWVCWCDGELDPRPRWLIVPNTPELEAVAA